MPPPTSTARRRSLPAKGASTSVNMMVIAVAWYLVGQGRLLQTIWLLGALLDTYRALRTIRPNGRAVGVMTKKSAMREALKGWVVYYSAEHLIPITQSLLGWIPLFQPISTVFSLAFLCLRPQISGEIYRSAISPFIKRYETPIDLTLSLLGSVLQFLAYYTVFGPMERIVGSLRALRLAIEIRWTRVLRQEKQAERSPDQAVKDAYLDEEPVTIPRVLDTKSAGNSSGLPNGRTIPLEAESQTSEHNGSTPPVSLVVPAASVAPSLPRADTNSRVTSSNPPHSLLDSNAGPSRPIASSNITVRRRGVGPQSEAKVKSSSVPRRVAPSIRSANIVPHRTVPNDQPSHTSGMSKAVTSRVQRDPADDRHLSIAKHKLAGGTSMTRKTDPQRSVLATAQRSTSVTARPRPRSQTTALRPPTVPASGSQISARSLEQSNRTAPSSTARVSPRKRHVEDPSDGLVTKRKKREVVSKDGVVPRSRVRTVTAPTSGTKPGRNGPAVGTVGASVSVRRTVRPIGSAGTTRTATISKPSVERVSKVEVFRDEPKESKAQGSSLHKV